MRKTKNLQKKRKDVSYDYIHAEITQMIFFFIFE